MAEPEMWDEPVGLRARTADTWGPGKGEREVAQGCGQLALSDLAFASPKVTVWLEGF